MNNLAGRNFQTGTLITVYTWLCSMKHLRQHNRVRPKPDEQLHSVTSSELPSVTSFETAAFHHVYIVHTVVSCVYLLGGEWEMFIFSCLNLFARHYILQTKQHVNKAPLAWWHNASFSKHYAWIMQHAEVFFLQICKKYKWYILSLYCDAASSLSDRDQPTFHRWSFYLVRLVRC